MIENLRKWNGDLGRALKKSEVPAHDDSCKVQGLKQRFNISRSNAPQQCLASFQRAPELGFCCFSSMPHQAAIGLDWASYKSNMGRTLKGAVSYEGARRHRGYAPGASLV